MKVIVHQSLPVLMLLNLSLIHSGLANDKGQEINREKLSDGSLAIITDSFITEASNVLTEMLSYPIV